MAWLFTIFPSVLTSHWVLKSKSISTVAALECSVLSTPPLLFILIGLTCFLMESCVCLEDSIVHYVQTNAYKQKHAQTLVWSFNCVWFTMSTESIFNSSIHLQKNRNHLGSVRGVRSFVISTVGFNVSTCCGLTETLPLYRVSIWSLQSALWFDSKAWALNIWVLVYHIIISSAGYKGSTTELQKTKEETKQ